MNKFKIILCFVVCLLIVLIACGFYITKLENDKFEREILPRMLLLKAYREKDIKYISELEDAYSWYLCNYEDNDCIIVSGKELQKIIETHNAILFAFKK